MFGFGQNRCSEMGPALTAPRSTVPGWEDAQVSERVPSCAAGVGGCQLAALGAASIPARAGEGQSCAWGGFGWGPHGPEQTRRSPRGCHAFRAAGSRVPRGTGRDSPERDPFGDALFCTMRRGCGRARESGICSHCSKQLQN